MVCVHERHRERMNDFSKKSKGHTFEKRDIREELKNTKECTFPFTPPLSSDHLQVEISLLLPPSPVER